MIGKLGRSNFPSWQPELTNATAGLMYQYGVYALDTLQANTNSTSLDLGLSNLVAVDATNVIVGGQFFVVQNAPAVGGLAQCIGKGVTTAWVLGPAGGTQNTGQGNNIGGWLLPIAGQIYLGTTGATATNAVGQVLTAVVGGGSAKTDVWFWGSNQPRIGA